MENNTRIFTKENDYEGSLEVLKLSDEDVLKKAFFSEQGYTFIVEEGQEHDIKSYREIGGITITEDDLKTSKIFTEYDVESDFVKLIMDDETEITEEETKKEVEKIKSFYNALKCVELTETYTYWDGSNHKTIELNNEYTDWIEIEGDDKEDFEIEEVIVVNNNADYEEKIVITESGKRVKITISFYQGEISDTWEFLELNYQDIIDEVKEIIDSSYMHMCYQSTVLENLKLGTHLEEEINFEKLHDKLKDEGILHTFSDDNDNDIYYSESLLEESDVDVNDDSLYNILVNRE